MKFERWLTLWREDVKTSVKKQTLCKYMRDMRLHVPERFKEKELSEIGEDDVQRLSDALMAEGLAPNSVRGVISSLRCALNAAADVGLIGRMDFKNVRLPRIRERKVECFEENDQRTLEKFLKNCKRKNMGGVLLCLYTGLRIGELLALEWRDVDLKKRLIYVRRTCRDSWKDGKYRKIIDSPKTFNSERIVPIPRQLVGFMREMKKSGQRFVVTGRTEYGTEVRTYQRAFANLLKKLKMAPKGFHSLRHTFATRALECGMDIKTLSDILGHKDSTLTLNRYAHSMLAHKVEMMDKVGKLYGK